MPVPRCFWKEKILQSGRCPFPSCQVVLKHPSIKLCKQQHDTSSNNSFKNNPKKRKEKKLVSEVEEGTKLSLEVRIYIYIYIFMYIYIFIYTASHFLSTYAVFKIQFHLSHFRTGNKKQAVSSLEKPGKIKDRSRMQRDTMRKKKTAK